MTKNTVKGKVEEWRARRIVESVPDSECSCPTCKGMCERRPCWPAPEEAAALIAAGYGPRLMLDYWVDCDRGDILILCPAIEGSEGRRAPFFPAGRCTLLDKRGLCEVHLLKPVEGRKAKCGWNEPPNFHEAVGKLWRTPAAEEIVRGWMATYGGER